MLTYAKAFIIGLLAAHAFCVQGGLPMYILYGVLLAHFITRSIPWATNKLSSAVAL